MSNEESPSIFRYLLDIDLFGKDIDIYYKGKSTRTSWPGRIFTIIYMGIYIFFLIFRLIRMLNKEDVTFYDTYAFNGEIPRMQLSHEIFYSGVALIHPLTKEPFVDPTIYSVKVLYFSGEKVGSGFNMTNRSLPIEICKLEKFGSNYREIYKRKNLSQLYCVTDFDQELKGHQTYDVYSYYSIIFSPCFNSTENNFSCRSEGYISAVLNQFGVIFVMQDVDLTPQDYEHPVQFRAKEVSLTVAQNLLIDVHSFWQIVNIETDEDIIGFGTSDNNKKEQYVKYDNAQMLYNMNNINL